MAILFDLPNQDDLDKNKKNKSPQSSYRFT